jgi:uncharacterized membrane protein (DUF106 family)
LAIDFLVQFLRDALSGFTEIPASTLFIAAVAILVGLGTNLLNKKLVNFDRIRETRKQFDAWRRQLNDAKKKNDKQAIGKLMKKQQAMMRVQSQVQMETMKPTLFLFIPLILMWQILGVVFPSTLIVARSPFLIPWPAISFIGWTGPFQDFTFVAWYILSSFSVSLPLSRILRTSYQVD